MAQRIAENVEKMRDDSGKLPAYAWPGGYPIIYIAGDGGIFCPACANGENGSDAGTDSADCDPAWRIELPNSEDKELQISLFFLAIRRKTVIEFISFLLYYQSCITG